MDISINLASQPYQQVQRLVFRWRLILSGMGLLAVVLLCAAVAACLSWRTTHNQAAALQRQIEELDRRKAEAENFMNRADNRQIRMRAEFLNAAIARKAFSWTEVFSDLEHIMPAHLRVISIHPEINGDRQLELQLTVSGSERQAAIDLVRRLEQSPHFAQAQINNEMSQNPQNAQGDSIQYSISAIYIPSFARDAAAGGREVVPHAADSASEADSGEMKEARNAGH